MRSYSGDGHKSAGIIAAALLVALAGVDVSGSLAQESAGEVSANSQLSLPEGFFPRFADKQAYASQKVQRFTTDPKYFSDKPAQIAEALAYLEYMIDTITRPSNFQLGPTDRQKYLEMRLKIRSKLGMDADVSPSAAIATLYTISKVDAGTLSLGSSTDDLRQTLINQGLDAAEATSLTEVFETSGFEVADVFTVGDAISDIFSEADLDSAAVAAIADALRIDASASFANAVSAFNSAFGTSLSVDQAREALGDGRRSGSRQLNRLAKLGVSRRFGKLVWMSGAKITSQRPLKVS